MSKNSDGDDVIINALIISIIIGIFISMAFLYLTRQAPDSFSEIYFNDHENLPNKVILYENYNFSTTLKNLESSNMNHNQITELELFKVYDNDVSFYDCKRDFRKKIYYYWDEFNESNEYIDVLGYDEILFKTMILEENEKYSDYELNGDHTFSFNLYPEYGIGSFSIILKNNTNEVFRIILSEKNKTIYLFENNILVSSNNMTFSQKLENKIKYKIQENNLNFTINNKQVLDYTFLKKPNGKLSFMTKNAYIKMNRPLLFTNNETIEFIIGSGRLNDNIGKIRSLKSDDISFKLKGESEVIRYNLSLNYFINTSSLDITGPLFSGIDLRALAYKEDPGIYPLLYDWAGFNYPLSDFPSYVYESLEHNITREKIDYESFNLSFKFDSRFGEKQLGMYFYDYKNLTKYMFLMSQKNSLFLFIKFKNGSLEITKKRLYFDEKPHSVLMHFNNDKLDIVMDSNYIMGVNEVNGNFSDISIESKNSYSLISNLKISSNDPSCNSKTHFEKCYKNYKLQGEKSLSEYENIEIDSSFDLQNLSVDIEKSESEILDFSFESIFPEEINKELKEKENEFIEDKNYILDGPSTQITNLNDYTFEFDYKNLEGKGIVYVGFMDLNYNDKLRIVI
ncbi:hypothetical protein HN451_01855, partial [archaeon]|nr:hypothetical protein [archaeon]